MNKKKVKEGNAAYTYTCTLISSKIFAKNGIESFKQFVPSQMQGWN